MASLLNVKESKGFCDEVYMQLADMKERIIEMKNRSIAKSPGKDIDGGMFIRHLSELADQIDWKLQRYYRIPAPLTGKALLITRRRRK